MKQTPLFHLLAAAVLVVAVIVSTGCAAAYRPLQIQPVAARSGKERTAVVPQFKNSYYYFDRDQNLFFVMRSATVDAATKKPIDQVFTARVFWRPVGGKTSLNNSSLNATFRYVLMTPDSVAMYEGAGFVRLWGKNGKASMRARLMDGDLRLTQASASFVDTLGRAHIEGTFTATLDDVKAFEMLMDAHREFFARSLESKPAATQPGEPPREEGFPIPLEPGAAPSFEPGAAVKPPETPSAPSSQP